MTHSLKLKYRILLGYTVPILLSVGVATIVHFNAKTVARLEAEVQLAQSTIIQVDRMVLGVIRMVRNIRGYVLFPTDQSYLASYEDGVRLFRQSAQDLDQLLEDPGQRQSLLTIATEANQQDVASRKVVQLIQQNQPANARDQLSKIRMRTIDETHEAMIAREEAILTAKADELEAAREQLTLVVFGGTVLAAILAIASGLWIASRISQTLYQTASLIADSSKQIANTAEQQEQTAAQQAASVNQTSVTMDELNQASQQSANQAEAANIKAQQALALSETGSTMVDQTLAGMTTLKAKVEAIVQQILYLSDRTNQIGSISNLVSDLANQTNMLALNAAVEAARAGEQGKGFAVVAVEIRKLADQSKQSTENIYALVHEIQKAIHATVTVTDEGNATVAGGMQLAEDTAQTFVAVTHAINEIVLSSQQISHTTQQQAIAIQQVVTAMNNLNQGATDTASGISQTKVGIDQLNAAALALKSIV